VVGRPSAWVVERCLALPANAVIVDLAAGLGRHALPLAARGRRVIAVDYVEGAVSAAARANPRIAAVVADAWSLPFAEASLDAVLTVNFLERTLFPSLVRLLRPGGRLIAETYTVSQRSLVEAGRARGPRNPAYLLAAGELRGLVAPLAVLDYREGLVTDDAGERYVASVVAERREHFEDERSSEQGEPTPRGDE